MPRGLGLSLLLHLGLFLVIAFGFPILFQDEKEFEPTAISVEILPITEKSNLPQMKKPISPKPPKPKEVVKPTPPTKTETQKPQPKKPAESVPLPDKPKPAEKETPKPKPEEKKPEVKKPQEDDFDKLLSKLKNDGTPDKQAQKKPDPDSADTSKHRSDVPYDPSRPLSISEKDAIRSQFVKCWRMPAGARNDYSLAVKIRVLLNQDGTVKKVGLVPDQVSRYQSDGFFKAAADSALRAVQLCSPLKNLPMDKYSSWSDMELNFDPQEMLY